MLLPVTPVVLALDKSRLWLPKKYSELMPKLVNTAVRAEKTSRCEWVISGEMQVHKSTAQDYYFVITCRDEEHTSYNLSYLYPVNGDNPTLIYEQGKRKTYADKKKAASAQTTVDKEPAIDAQMALDICHEAVNVKTETLDSVLILDAEISPVVQQQGSFFYQFPFNVDSALGNDIRYQADCTVGADGSANVDIFLQSAGALALCKDSLKEETLLMRHVNVREEPLQELKNEQGGFFYTLEFNTKSRRGSPIRYTAECSVEADASNEIKVLLDKSGALAICKDTLRSEAIRLKGLEVIDKQIPEVVENEQGFFYVLPFEATMPGGDKGLYKASCQVDAEGSGDVSFSIDKKAVMPLCIDKLRVKTRTMINVTLLDQSITVEESKEGYMGNIPFNANSPMGKRLYYQAICQVNGIGMASVTISSRIK